MLRSLYLGLIRLHPRSFRRQFGAEMIWIFDQAEDHTTRLALLTDALISVLRQRWLRPAPTAPGPIAHPSGLPAFTVLDTSLSPATLLRGAVASLLLVSLAGLLPMSPPDHRGLYSPGGLSTSAPGLVPPLTAGSPDPPLTVRTQGAADVLLGMLDADGDLTLTPAEIERAPGVLTLLDADIDGSLTWRECVTGRDYLNAPRFASRLFSALDSTGNGVISSGERLHSAAALAALDTNGDGRVSRREWRDRQ